LPIGGRFAVSALGPTTRLLFHFKRAFPARPLRRSRRRRRPTVPAAAVAAEVYVTPIVWTCK